MNIVATVSKVGPLFQQSTRDTIVKLNMARGVDGATNYLSTAVRAVTPVASGKLRASVKVIGSGLGKRVQAGEWYAIPLDSGAVASSVPISKLENWVRNRLGRGGIEGRRMAFAISKSHAREPRKAKEFFYRTFDRLQGFLHSQFLGPAGLAIVKELE